MGYLKSGISRCVAVLSACGVVTVSAVTFATLDKNVIQPCAVMPPENAKVISVVSDKETTLLTFSPSWCRNCIKNATFVL